MGTPTGDEWVGSGTAIQDLERTSLQALRTQQESGVSLGPRQWASSLQQVAETLGA